MGKQAHNTVNRNTLPRIEDINNDDYYSTGEVSELFGITKSGLYTSISRGTFPTLNRIMVLEKGRTVHLWPKKDVREYYARPETLRERNTSVSIIKEEFAHLRQFMSDKDACNRLIHVYDVSPQTIRKHLNVEFYDSDDLQAEKKKVRRKKHETKKV